MLIPNAERAVVDIRKLRDYCLNPLHDEGKHKARLFAAVGITANDAEDLHDILLQAVKTYDAQLGRRDTYGQRYIVDFPLHMAWQTDPDPERMDYRARNGCPTVDHMLSSMSRRGAQ